MTKKCAAILNITDWVGQAETQIDLPEYNDSDLDAPDAFGTAEPRPEVISKVQPLSSVTDARASALEESKAEQILLAGPNTVQEHLEMSTKQTSKQEAL